MKGWHNESYRHVLASHGIRTKFELPNNKSILDRFFIEKRSNYLDNTGELLEETILMKTKTDAIGHGTLIIDHRNKNIDIGGIRIYEKYRGKGLSRLLMSELVKVIDDIGYEAQLTVMADDDSGLGERGLVKLCNSFGFEMINYRTLEMRRPSRGRNSNR